MEKCLFTSLLIIFSWYVGISQKTQVESNYSFLDYLNQPIDSLDDEVLFTDQVKGKDQLLFAKLNSHNLFGSIPKETLVSLDQDNRVSKFQINIDFDEKEKISYKVLMELVKDFSGNFGKPTIRWINNLMEFEWSIEDKNFKVSQIELKELDLVIIRVDLAFKKAS